MKRAFTVTILLLATLLSSLVIAGCDEEAGSPLVTFSAVDADNITSTSAVLHGGITWIMNPRIISHVYFRWRQPGQAFTSGDRIIQQSYDSLSFIAEDLTPDTTYHFEVVAYVTNPNDETERHYLSSEQSYFTTLPEDTDRIRLNTNPATDIESTSATVHGELVYIHPEFEIVTISFVWSPVRSEIEDEDPNYLFPNGRSVGTMTTPGLFEIDIIDLSPYTRYYYRALARLGSGAPMPGHTRYFGEIQEFMTLPPLATPLPPTPPTVTPVPTVPIAEWHFDEGSGASVTDSSGNGNHGTLMGDTNWTDGPDSYGKALAFDGDGDYVEISNESNFDFDKDDAFTIEAYIKTDSDDTLVIASKMPILKPARGYQLIKHSPTIDDIDPGGGNRIYLFLDSVYDSADGFINTDSIVVYGSTDIKDGEWHHVKVTYDGSATAAGIQIYIDGKPEVMHTRTHGENKGLWDTLSGSILNDLPLQISGRDGDDVSWDGLIDEVIIWEGVR